MATSILNNPNCVNLVGANTGVPACYLNPTRIVGALLVHPTWSYSIGTTVDQIVEDLQLAALSDSTSRIFPVFRFEAITDNTEKKVVSTLGYGGRQVVREGKYDWDFLFVKGGLNFSNNLRKFNTKGYKVLFFDDSYTLYGTLNSSGQLVGLTTDFIFTDPFKPNDGSKAVEYHINFVLTKPAELNEKVGVIKFEDDPEDLFKGLINLELFPLEIASGKSTVGIRTDADKVDLYAAYADAFADADLWIVTNTSTGADVTVTSVAKNATLKGWDVSFTGTGEFKIALAPPADLADANIGGTPDNGYEGLPLNVTVTA